MKRVSLSRDAIYDWIALSKQNEDVARVYPSWTLVSLMGCKRAKGVYIWRMGQRDTYRRRNRRKCQSERKKTLVYQSNKSLALLPGLPHDFFSLTHFSPHDVNYNVNFNFSRIIFNMINFFVYPFPRDNYFAS